MTVDFDVRILVQIIYGGVNRCHDFTLKRVI